MRSFIWSKIRQRIPEGDVLPWWALTIRAVLYPLEFFYWRMSKTTGYQLDTDTWLIDGVKYSGAALHYLAESQDKVYRVGRHGDAVVMTEVKDVK